MTSLGDYGHCDMNVRKYNDYDIKCKQADRHPQLLCRLVLQPHQRGLFVCPQSHEHASGE